ncbi:MAG TPA: hypothetical protein VMT32_16180 [Bryobacteraceae bacterium]|nr:hypothetical protein [Bryobacteraceae bacterium]
MGIMRFKAVEVNGDWELFTAGIAKEQFEGHLPPNQRRSRYIVTSDGKRFLMNAPGRGAGAREFPGGVDWPALRKR